MFNQFKKPDEKYYPPLSERVKLEQSANYIDVIQEYAEDNIIHMVGNNHPLVRLVKSIENKYLRSELYDYLRIGSERADGVARSLGMVTTKAVGNPQSMRLTNPGTFDLMYVEDRFVKDYKNEPMMRCLYHPFTNLDLTLPNYKWKGGVKNGYSIWSINIYVVSMKWRQYVLNQPGDKPVTHKGFVNQMLCETLSEISDHSLLNTKLRNYELDDLDPPNANPYSFFTRPQLNRVRMYPQRTTDLREILFTLPSVQADGLLGTLDVGDTPFRKHLIVLYALARLPVYNQVASVNRGKLPPASKQLLNYLHNRINGLSLTPTYPILPETLMREFLANLEETYQRLT